MRIKNITEGLIYVGGFGIEAGCEIDLVDLKSSCYEYENLVREGRIEMIQ